MGCCQGKPNAQKLSDHEKCSNPENDISFIPDYSQTEQKILALEQEIEQNQSPSQIQKHLREVRRLQANVVVHKNKAKKECETQGKQQSEADFLIEIRKGKDIPSMRCIGGSKSFVQFQIQPWGVNYETMQGNAWIPK